MKKLLWIAILSIIAARAGYSQTDRHAQLRTALLAEERQYGQTISQRLKAELYMLADSPVVRTSFLDEALTREEQRLGRPLSARFKAEINLLRKPPVAKDQANKGSNAPSPASEDQSPKNIDFSHFQKCEIVYGAHFTSIVGSTNRLSVTCDDKHMLGKFEFLDHRGIGEPTLVELLRNETFRALEKAGMNRVDVKYTDNQIRAMEIVYYYAKASALPAK
ncbi:MAG: hypothetical protein HY401_05780 [Elusimicrobia bacterium]|nr:hypothetical protein [Elusimicrobiota bacterium]